MFMYHVARLTYPDLLYGCGVSGVLQGHICPFPSKEDHATTLTLSQELP